MERLNHEQMVAAATDLFEAIPDETGVADLISNRGRILLAPELGGMKEIFQTAKTIDGYKWVMINSADMVLANTLSIGSKAGIVAADGKVLKNADLPRRTI